MIIEFKVKCRGYLWQLMIAKYYIEETPENTQSMYSAPYQAEPKVQKFEMVEIYKMLQQIVSKLVQRKFTAPILFAPKKDGSLHYNLHYRKLSH